MTSDEGWSLKFARVMATEDCLGAVTGIIPSGDAPKSSPHSSPRLLLPGPLREEAHGALDLRDPLGAGTAPGSSPPLGGGR